MSNTTYLPKTEPMGASEHPSFSGPAWAENLKGIAQTLRSLGRSPAHVPRAAAYGIEAGARLHAATAVPVTTISHIQQNLGNQRENQEDSAAAWELELLTNGRPSKVRAYLAYDGCGGMTGGELASQIGCSVTIQSLGQQILSSEAPHHLLGSAHALEQLLEQSFADANHAIYRPAAKTAQPAGMASTGECLLICADRFCAAHVGDSRVYQYRRGMLTQLTVDHNRAQWLVQQGILTPEEARFHHGRCHLTNAFGVNAEIIPDFIHGEVLPGDLYLLSTDGFHEGLTTDQICRACQKHLRGNPGLGDLRALATALEEDSLAGYGNDNLTAVFVLVQQQEDPPSLPLDLSFQPSNNDPKKRR